MRHAFEHACRRCTAVFSPALELDNFSVLTAACPHCGYAHGYDNRDGKILRLLREKQGLTESHPEPEAPVEAALTPPPEPPALETEPAPIPWTTTAVEPEYQDTDSFEQNEPEITREREPWRSRLPGIRQVVFVASTLATLLVVAVMVMQAIPVSDEEAKGYLAQLKSREADVVLDRNGHELNRLGVSGSEKALLTDYPRWQIDTLLFAEDKNFFHHHGVEYTAILRAVLNNALRLRYARARDC